MRKLKVKNIAIVAAILLFIIILIVLLVTKSKNKKTENPKVDNKKVEEKVEEPKKKINIVDVNSKTRPFAVSINNTPVAIKVQTGLNKAYLIYEIATEGSTSRLFAFYKDSENVTLGTIRSARHNFIDFALESDAIFAAYGWSIYAEEQLRGGAIDYVNGMIHAKPFWRNNPEKLTSEHTAYTSISKLEDYAYNTLKYKKDSSDAKKTILLNYSEDDVDLSKKENSVTANSVSIPYGSVTTVFKYNPDSKMYTRVVNGTVTKDHETKEEFTTKNIIVERLTYEMADNNYYWNLHTVGSGEGYYITNGYAVPIKWSKSDRSSKTKYTYLDGKEIEVSDGRTYIEVQVTGKKTTIN